MNTNYNYIMRKTSIILFMLAMFIACCHKANVNTIEQFEQNPTLNNSGFDTERVQQIDTAMAHYIKKGYVPGIVTFIAKNGKVVHHKAYGYSNLESKKAMEVTNIFRIASQTKAISSVALMTLYEKGFFLLDEPISKYIPEFKNPGVLVDFNEKDTTYTTRPAKREITIRHLLSHSSGIHYGVLGGGMGSMMYAKEGIPAVNSLENITIGQVVKKIAKMPLLHDPGEKFTYGMNTDVIGYLIEILSGKSFDVFMKETVLDPLGMDDTYFYVPPEKEERVVSLYSSSKDGLKYHKNESYQTYPYAGAKTFLSGGAGLCGTIEDYAKFCQMMLNKGEFNGKKILGRKTVELMTKNQLAERVFIWNGHKFGLGFELIDSKASSEHLWSEGSFRWGGMYYTDYLIDPHENLIMLFYTNVEPYRGPNLHERFHNLVYQALE